MTLAERLQRLQGRPTLLAIAAMNAITGLVAAWVLAPLSFGADADTYRRGAEALAAGTYDKDFLYSPLAALLATPLTWMPAAAAAVLMTGVGAAVLAIGIALETRRMDPVDRILVAVAAFGFLPVVNELLLGQITLLFAAALWPIVRWPDRRRNGVAFGIAMALAPKPALLPVLVWMLLRRRRALLGVVVAGAATALVGLMACGVGAHLHWLDVLTRAGSVDRRGNVSLWTDGVAAWNVAAAVVVTMATAFCLWRSEDAGLVAVLLAGLLLAPYTLIYSATILLLVVRTTARLAPWSTRVLTLAANPALLGAAPAWLGLSLAADAAAVWRSPRET